METETTINVSDEASDNSHSCRGWVVVASCVLLPIPAAILALWLNPEHEGMCVDFFIIFGAFPIGWSFTGIGCWVLGRIWNRDRTVCTFLRFPVVYWGTILFVIGCGVSLFGLWEMYVNGLFPWLSWR
jgi:hypothetical protein